MKRILLVFAFLMSFGLFNQANSQFVPCIDSSLFAPPACPFIYAPVCGCNGVTYSNSCIAEKTGGVAVYVNGPCNAVGCQANFTFTTTGYTATFTDNSGTGINSWFWNFGDGNTSSMPNTSHVYANPGTYTVCLIIVTSSGCADSSCATITITGTTPCVDSSLIDPFGICPTIYAPVCGCDGVTYSNACVAEKQGGVTSYVTGPCNTGGCTADFSHTLMAAPNSVAFFDSSSGGPFASWLWDFGDGNFSSLQNPTHMYAQPGTYTACLTVVSSTGCVDSICQTINTVGTPCVDPTQIDSSIICFTLYQPVCGCNGVTYSNDCVAQYYGGVTSWTNGPCTSGGCQAYYTYFFGFNPLGVIFTDSSTSAPNDPIMSWAWDFGDGNTSNIQDPMHIYSQAGVYTVCLTITTQSGCTDMYCFSIPVASAGGCNAVFTYNVNPSGSVVFSNQSTGAAPFTYMWDLGDGTTSNQQDPQHLYATGGVYYVCMTVTDATGCMDMICDTVSVVIQGIDDSNPSNFNLSSFPNPFEGQTTIHYELANSAVVNLAVFDILGNKIKSLITKKQSSGKYNFIWNAENYSPGIYFITLQADDKKVSTKLTLIK